MSEALPLGRDRELAEVDRFLERITSGPHGLALTGPAGIGKTTVWQEACRRAAASGCRVLVSRPSQSEAGFAFAALADLLAPVAPSEFDALPRVLRHAIDVALLRADATEAVDGRSIATALLELLRRLSGDRRLVVAVDDAQWLDTASADALAFAVRRLGGAPVGVLASVRVEGLRTPTFEQSMPAERRVEVHIGPLGVAALHEIVKRHLDVTVPRPTLVRVVTASGGNPFYAVEIARELVRAGLPAPGAKLPVPGSLKALVGTRVARLPQPTRDALLMAACMAQPTGDVVDVGALEPAEEAGVVHVEKGGRIRFDHPLRAAAVYESAPAARRRAAHRELAVRVTDPEERALHLASGTDAADEAVANLLEAAAARAAARGATRRAAELAGRAVELSPDRHSPEGVRRAIEAANYISESGQGPAAAVALLEAALDGRGGADLQGEVHFNLGRIMYGEGDGDGALRHLERAIALSSDPLVLARAHAELAWQLRGDIPRSVEHCDAVLALVGEADAPVVYSTTLMLRAYQRLIAGQGADDEAIERGWRLQVPGRDTSPVPLAWPVMHDDFTEGRARYEYGLRSRSSIGDELSGISLLAHLSEIELWTGNWARADALASEAMDVVERSGSGSFLNNALFARGMVDAHLGRVDAARAAGERILGLEYVTADGPLRGHILLGFLALSLGELGRSDQHYRTAAGILEARGEREPARFRFHPDLVEVAIALGDVDRAAAELARLDQRALAFPRPWILATAERCRALLLAARGELDLALEAARRALERHDALGMPFERARTELVAGRLLRRRNERRAARETLGDALAEFERLGARLWSEQTRAELSRVPVRKSSSDLTPTEERIARLAASGLTNREVAELAFVSAKTVEANLARVYDKLGVRSRAELGRVMGERERAVKT